MKKIFTISVLALVGISGFAQNAQIKWGFEGKTETTFGSFVNGAGTDMIKLCFETKKGVRFFGIGGSGTITPIIARYNEKLMEVTEKRFEADDKNTFFNDLLSVKGKLFLFTSQYDKETKSTTFYSQQLNITSLNPEGGNAKNLGAFDAINKSSQSTVGYELSKDSSKILMFGLSPASRKDDEKYYIGVYDADMQKQWEKTVTLPYKDKYITVLDRLVTNEGKVGVIIKHYDQEVSREAITKDGTKVPSYKTKLLLYDNTSEKPVEFLLDLGDKFVHTIDLTEDISTSLQLFGLYKDKYNGYITGYFIAVVNKETKSVTTHNVVAFPADMVHLVKTDKQGSEKERDPGIANDFKLAQVEETADGSKHYMLEYTRAIYHPGSYTYSANGGGSSSPPYWEYRNGDIIVISIRKNNTNVLVRIPKMQVAINTKAFSSFKALPYKNKLAIFYNDNEDNAEKAIEKRPDDLRRFDKSVFQMAVVDDKGGLERSQLYTHRDMRLTTAIRECRPLDKKRLGLFAQKGAGLFSSGKDMVGILEVK
jgi:hypothetical protein